MNKEIKFGFPGGFPLVQDTLAQMQLGAKSTESYGQAMCAQQGSNYLIVSGCETKGTTVTEGVVIVDGEVLTFVGGKLQATVILKEVAQPALFHDGQSHDIYITRTLIFGGGLGAILWSGFKRITATSYDYVVDSNEKLAGLHNNELATNVLVKKGVYQTSSDIELHAKTKRITGEVGAKLEFVGAASLSYPHSVVLGYAEGASIRDLLFHFIALNGASGGLSGLSAISNCHFHMLSEEDSEDNQIPMIGTCTNITGCTIKHFGGQLKTVIAECERISNCIVEGSLGFTYLDTNEGVFNCDFDGVTYSNARATIGCTFNYSHISLCENMSNCLFTSRDVPPAGYRGYPMRECVKVTNCHYRGASATPYMDSYASYENHSEYACDDTPAGGFNSVQR